MDLESTASQGCYRRNQKIHTAWLQLSLLSLCLLFKDSEDDTNAIFSSTSKSSSNSSSSSITINRKFISNNDDLQTNLLLIFATSTTTAPSFIVIGSVIVVGNSKSKSNSNSNWNWNPTNILFNVIFLCFGRQHQHQRPNNSRTKYNNSPYFWYRNNFSS